MIDADTAKGVTDFLNAEPGTLLGGPTGPGEDDGAGAAMEAYLSSLEFGNQDPNIAVDGNLETKVNGCINNELTVDGKGLTVATAEVEFELAQRGGFKMSPHQQTQIVTNGNPTR